LQFLGPHTIFEHDGYCGFLQAFFTLKLPDLQSQESKDGRIFGRP
jgi:hypothetical protein